MGCAKGIVVYSQKTERVTTGIERIMDEGKINLKEGIEKVVQSQGKEDALLASS